MGTLTLSQTNPDFYRLQYNTFENNVEKGEIARNELFLIFPQCFLLVWKIFFHYSPI